MNIRRLSPGDGPGIAAIAEESPQAASWSASSYEDYPGWVAEEGGKLAGFVIVRAMTDEMEILNLAVVPARRRNGIGAQLLGAALHLGRRSGVRRVFLEVRESNLEARRFYERAGFAVVGRRSGFYRAPEEAALLMARSLNSRC